MNMTLNNVCAAPCCQFNFRNPHWSFVRLAH